MKIISLYIDNTSVRVTVALGKQIKDWACIPLESGLVENNIVVDKVGLASRIKLAFKTLEISGKTVNVGLSGLRCLNRVITLPELPGDMLGKAVTREAKRVLPVPLEELYLSWQSIRNPDGQLKVIMTAVPRITVDSVVETLHLAGLRVNFLGIKPLLLARMVEQPDAIVIDVQPTDFDILIMAGGAPQATRTIPFPGQELSPENKLEMIRNEFDRTLSFYIANNPGASPEELPVIISGQLSEELDLCKVFRENTTHPVVAMESLVGAPDGFDSSLYLPNIGLSMFKPGLTFKSNSMIIMLNSLPAEYQTRQISLSNIIVIPGAIAAVALIFILFLANKSVGAEVNSMSVKASAVEQASQESVTNKQALTGDIQQLEKTLKNIQSTSDNYLLALNAIEKQRLRTNEDLLALVQDLPKTITLSMIKHTGVTLEISGLARSGDDVLAYLTHLQRSNLFGEIAVTNMFKVPDKGVSFTMQVNRENPGDQISGIKVALKYLPTDVTLINFSQAKDTITINGYSSNEDSIVLFLRQLEASKLFREISLSGKTANVNGGLDFSVFVRM